MPHVAAVSVEVRLKPETASNAGEADSVALDLFSFWFKFMYVCF